MCRSVWNRWPSNVAMPQASAVLQGVEPQGGGGRGGLDVEDPEHAALKPRRVIVRVPQRNGASVLFVHRDFSTRSSI
jgi:hypothetical protein